MQPTPETGKTPIKLQFFIYSLITLLLSSTSSLPCDSCPNANNTPTSTARQFQLPPGLAETVQVFASKVFKAFSLYQPELHGITCVLKYYKLLSFINLPSSMEDYLTLFSRYRTNSTPPPPDNTSSARTFFPFPDLDLKETQQIATLTLWHCAKVYLFSFFVRFLEIIYFI